MNRPLTSGDIALIIPTKDRPDKVENLLKSLLIQKEPPGRILIIDGGKLIENFIAKYSNELPIEYYQYSPPSLTGQRNAGLSKIDDRTPLIGFIGDDIIFDKGALSELISFWNNKSDRTAAVSFNIINVPKIHYGFLHRLFFLANHRPGRVLKSGVTTTYHNFDFNMKTEWVSGGTTIWRRDILRRFPPMGEIVSRWAVCEDLIHSYPIGKKYDLFFCSSAKVIHDHDNDFHDNHTVDRYIGFNEVLWRLYFVTQNKDMSAFAWFLYAIGRFGNNIWYAISRKDKGFFKKALGNLSGCYRGLEIIATGQKFKSILNETNTD